MFPLFPENPTFHVEDLSIALIWREPPGADVDTTTRSRVSLAELRTELGQLGRDLRPHALPLIAVTALLGILYWSTMRWLSNAWLNNDYYSHGFLVPPIALFFAWRARKKIAAAAYEPSLPKNLVWLLGGVLLYAYGWYQHDPFYLSLSLIAMLAGLAVYLMGLPRGKYLLLPAAFLLLAIPPPNLLELGLQMQVLASWGTTRFLTLFGVPMVQDNFTIHAGGLSFQVVPMCSGLSSTISILTLTTVVAAIMPLQTWARGLVVASCVPIALAANILRISLTIWIGITWGPEASEGFLHGASSMVLFLISLTLVLALAVGLSKIPLNRKVVADG